MSIGFIFECGPQGADKQVCEYLASQLQPGKKLISRTMDNKLKLLDGAAGVAKKLLTEGCKKVLIVWDLRPAWPTATTDARMAVTRAVETSGLRSPNNVGKRAKAKPHWHAAITQSCHMPLTSWVSRASAAREPGRTRTLTESAR